eukprot:1196050-Prorocentrum_minimum.AAC.2
MSGVVVDMYVNLQTAKQQQLTDHPWVLWSQGLDWGRKPASISSSLLVPALHKVSEGRRRRQFQSFSQRYWQRTGGMSCVPFVALRIALLGWARQRELHTTPPLSTKRLTQKEKVRLNAGDLSFLGTDPRGDMPPKPRPDSQIAVPGYGAGGGGAPAFTPTRELTKRKNYFKRCSFMLQHLATSMSMRTWHWRKLNPYFVHTLISQSCVTSFPSLNYKASTNRETLVGTARYQTIEYEEALKVAESRKFPEFRVGDVVEIKLVVPENKNALESFRGVITRRQNRGLVGQIQGNL